MRRACPDGEWWRLWPAALVVALTGALGQTAAAADAPAPEDELSALRRQVAFLSKALADARAETDSLKALQARQQLGAGESALEPAEMVTQALDQGIKLVDVNRELRMVVFSAGRRQGLTAGMVFTVMQAERAVARVRVVDVRRALAGAVIEELTGGAFPAEGDRVLMAPTAQ